MKNILIALILVACDKKSSEEADSSGYCYGDPNQNLISNDKDCDGVLASEDCDDNDYFTIHDMDCDGNWFNEDCDDFDASSTVIREDLDCDGIITKEDCDDEDPNATHIGIDTDCDGVLTEDDCDDSNFSVGSQDNDLDCDGRITTNDCNDNNETIFPGAPEIPNDGIDQDCDGFDIPPSWEYCPKEQTFEEAQFQFVGEDQNNAAGRSVSSAGDVDGDGLDDVLIGSVVIGDYGGWGENSGTVYLLFGSDLRINTSLNLEDASYSFVGEDGVNFPGRSVSSAGDVDGDGLDDILIGAPDLYSAGMDDFSVGKTYLILGADLQTPRNINLENASYSFIGGDRAGYAISSAGDVDGDGLDDILIGDIEYDTSARGKVHLILGSDLGEHKEINLENDSYTFVGEDGLHEAGYAISSAGDVDGDGLDDILIGAPSYYRPGEIGYNVGKIYLVFGVNLRADKNINLKDASYSFTGKHGSYYVGKSLSSAGDVDGDGLDDILIGARLVLGSDLGRVKDIDLDYAYTFLAENVGTATPASSAGDVDGDGLDDILIGAPGQISDGDMGKAYLILGADLGTERNINLEDVAYSFLGENDSLSTGRSVSSAGDINGDGLDDILIGAPYSDDRTGKVALYSACSVSEQE